VPVKNHKLAQNNPNALSHKLYSLEDVLNSKKITADLRILDCSRSCTGGASILLASEEKCKTLTDNPIWITGIGQKTISAGFTKNNLTHLDSPRLAGYEAIKMAKCEINDIDVAEIHDAFSVCEPMILEALGFSKRGKGMELVSNLYETNSPKINPRGGLIGSGHPLGATGLAKTIEITQQLQNCAGKRQVSRATAGLVHNMSAAATSSTILVLKNEI
jgi:acetyl-CoA C-acetyltransferase